MLGRLLWGLYILANLGGFAAPALADKRVALLIGNAHYSHVPALNNPVNDVTSMSDALRTAGFGVIQARTDLTHQGMIDALREFNKEANGADVAVIYYSGHGMEAKGVNYLLPVDATLETDLDLEDEAVSLDRAMRAMEGAGHLKLIILDACRNDPFQEQMARANPNRAISRGLARTEPNTTNTLIAYSAAVGTVASDGTGSNSPFTASLIKHIVEPGLDVRIMLGEVRDDVMAATDSQQQPFVNGSLGGSNLPLMPALDAAPNKGSDRTQQAVVTAPANLTPVPLTDCDRLAASPIGKDKTEGGVALDKIDAPAAEAACQQAVQQYPGEHRFSYQLGRAFAAGKNYVEAMRWYQKAADLGVADAMNNLGGMYTAGRGVKQDYAEGMRWYQKAAALGEPIAMTNIGLMYSNGRGIKQDYAEAMRWYQKAVELGNAEATKSIGVLYEYGQGVPQDYAEAMRWYQKAADIGNAEAIIHVGILYATGHGVTQNYAEALRQYQKAADLGNTNAMADVGLLYESGHGVTKDYSQALRWYQKAADLGNTSAMAYVGVLYENGHGVTQDYAEAMRRYQQSADLGNTSAMKNIGVLYENGHGVKQNYGEAMRQYQKAADLGNANAMKNIGVLYQYGHGVTIDYVEALHWYQKAADLGDANAMNNMGTLYETGHGVTRDNSQALRWYRKAADLGDTAAIANLRRLIK